MICVDSAYFPIIVNASSLHRQDCRNISSEFCQTNAKLNLWQYSRIKDSFNNQMQRLVKFINYSIIFIAKLFAMCKTVIIFYDLNKLISFQCNDMMRSFTIGYTLLKCIENVNKALIVSDSVLWIMFCVSKVTEYKPCEALENSKVTLQNLLESLLLNSMSPLQDTLDLHIT